MWKLIFIICIKIYLLNNIYSTKIKQQQKTFGEIFGDNWQKGNAQQTDRQNIQRAKEIMEEQFNEVFDENWGNEEMGEEDNSSQKSEEMGERNDQQFGIETNEQKRQIIEKFQKIKNEYKERGEYSEKERSKIEAKITRQLGVSQRKIYKWKKELGMKKRKITEEQKKICIEKYSYLKNEFTSKGKHSQKEWQQFFIEIKRKIAFNYATINRWKKKFGISYGHSRINDTDTKMKIIKKYEEIEQKYRQQRKHSKEEWHQFMRIITKKLGASQKTICKWKRQFFSPDTIRKWEKQFEKELNKI